MAQFKQFLRIFVALSLIPWSSQATDPGQKSTSRTQAKEQPSEASALVERISSLPLTMDLLVYSMAILGAGRSSVNSAMKASRNAGRHRSPLVSIRQNEFLIDRDSTGIYLESLKPFAVRFRAKTWRANLAQTFDENSRSLLGFLKSSSSTSRTLFWEEARADYDLVGLSMMVTAFGFLVSAAYSNSPRSLALMSGLGALLILGIISRMNDGVDLKRMKAIGEIDFQQVDWSQMNAQLKCKHGHIKFEFSERDLSGVQIKKTTEGGSFELINASGDATPLKVEGLAGSVMKIILDHSVLKKMTLNCTNEDDAKRIMSEFKGRLKTFAQGMSEAAEVMKTIPVLKNTLQKNYKGPFPKTNSVQ